MTLIKKMIIHALWQKTCKDEDEPSQAKKEKKKDADEKEEMIWQKNSDN